MLVVPTENRRGYDDRQLTKNNGDLIAGFDGSAIPPVYSGKIAQRTCSARRSALDKTPVWGMIAH